MSGAQIVAFPFLLLMLPIVAALAWWMKHRYAAALVRLQKASNPPRRPQDLSATAPSPGACVAHRALPELKVRIQPAHQVVQPSNEVDGSAPASRLRRRVLAVQFWCGLLYWSALLLLVTTGFVVAVSGFAGATSALAVLVLAGPSLILFVLAPASIAWVLQAGVNRTPMNVAATLVLFGAVVLFQYEGEWSSALGLSVNYASTALAVSAFMRPSVRGAGIPLGVAAIVGWLVLSVLFASAVALDESPDDTVMSFAEVSVGLVTLLLILAVTALCSWRALMLLSVRYAAKRFSDMELALDTYWALLTAFMLASVLRDQVYLSLTGWSAEALCVAIVLVWLVWRFVQGMALRRAVRKAGPSIGPLLFLRVFKPSRRSEAFADRLFSYWRFAGPVWMIGGPDLAGAYLEPNEFFAYLRGRLRDHFVADPQEAAGRIEKLDSVRDPDGRFRVNEMLCTNDTWQPVALEMIARAGVVLLDLREYSKQRRGTRFELASLLRCAPLNKVLLLIDAKDDVATLTAEVESIWQEVAESRADVGAVGHLQVLQFSSGSNAEMRGLFRASVRATAWS